VASTEATQCAPPTPRIAVYDLLEEAGFEVYLVNARETRNLPRRKSDVQGANDQKTVWNNSARPREFRCSITTGSPALPPLPEEA